MQTTGLFTVHEVRIKAKIGEPVTLFPFGDVHRDSNLHALREWQEFLEHAKKKKNALFLGMGDYSDGLSTSERTIIGCGGLHETTHKSLEKLYAGHTANFAKEIAFMRGRLLGLMGGNHYVTFADGSNSDNMLCSLMGAKFLGVCSFIRLVFEIEGRTNKTISVDIFAHHGKGGGQTPGATFNTIEKMMAGADADIYLMGHDHRKGCIPSTPRLKLISSGGNLNVSEREPWLGRTGSFLKAYEPGEVSYNVDAGRSPCALGWIELELTPLRIQHVMADGGREDRLKVKIRGTS